MDRAHEPATELQLRRLEQMGCDPGRALTRQEAATLLHELEVKSHEPQVTAAAFPERVPLAVQRRVEMEDAKLALIAALPTEEASLKARVEQLRAQRQEFWINTCREPEVMRDVCGETLDLYRQHGCLFTVPSHEQVQEVLDALDGAMSAWDGEHPELFFRTLELNFPSLLKRGC